MTIWSRFTAWLSGWPESKNHRSHHQEDIWFEEEENLRKEREKKKPKGLNSKKKSFYGHGDKI